MQDRRPDSSVKQWLPVKQVSVYVEIQAFPLIFEYKIEPLDRMIIARKTSS
jgi:hypothetical protein